MLGLSSGTVYKRAARRASNLRNSTALARLVASIAVMAGLGSPLVAAEFTGAGQSGFNEYIPIATQQGADDVVNITIGDTSGSVVIGDDLALPGTATGIDLNFIAGSSGGPGRVGVQNGSEFVVEDGAAIYFNGNSRFDIGYDPDPAGTIEGAVLMTGGSVTLGKEGGYSVLNVGYTGTGSFIQTGGAIHLDGSALQLGVVGGSGDYAMSGGTFNLTAGSSIYVGEGAGGDGTLTISGNAKFTTDNVVSGSGTQIFVGTNGGTGRIVQDSPDSLVSIDTGSSAFWFGWNDGAAGGDGAYDLRDGTFEVLSTQGATFGRDADTTGSFLQSGGDFSSEGAVVISRDGTGSYELSGGTADFLAGLQIATQSGTGAVTQTGGTATVTGGLRFGTGSGTGTYTLSGGTLTVDAITGGNANSSFIFDGGTLVASDSFSVPTIIDTTFQSDSTISVVDGETLTWNGAISGNGGVTKDGAATLSLGGDNSLYGGDVSLVGGTLALTNKNGIGIGNAVAMAADTVFDLTALDAGNPGSGAGIVQIGTLTGAGQVKLGDSFLVSSIGAGASAGFSGTITSDGWAYDSTYGRFYKAGDGDLVINGSAMEKGEATIIAGSMTQSTGDTAWSNINVGGDGGTGQLNVSGGTLTLNVGLRVGDFGGTGTVNQTGGTVRLAQTCDDDDRCASLNIGNQGGTGTYNISGGSLLLEGGSHSIGRNATSRPTSSGELNISGTGLVQLSPSVGDGFLVIGDRDAGTQPNSSGVINQTGGTLRISDGSRFYLGGYGSGTYNLSGGTLEIGGASLLGLYGGGGNTTGSYDFNLGGGTIKVIGTALNTAVDAELVANTASTIDTNGLGATWSGQFSGDGDLIKQGVGTLSLGGDNSAFTGDVSLVGGTLAVTNNLALGTSNDVAVGPGTTFDISGTPIGVQIGALSSSGEILLGTKLLSTTIGAGQTAAFSGTIQSSGMAWDADYGKFNKGGEGTLVIDGADMNGGEFYVSGGTVRQTSGNTSIDYLDVGTGTTNSVANAGELEVSGGTLSLQSLSIGGWGGIGEVNQTGGTVAVLGCNGASDSCGGMNVGNQGGQGTYNISGGVMAFESGGVFNLGRFSNNSYSTSEGELNISGTGEVRIEDGSLIIGNWLLSGTPNLGDGVINQTGGVLFVANDSQLYLSAQGDGAYNLSGGVLQIGGTSLIGDYNNGAGNYAFNLGEATLEVTGAALTTEVNATLQDGTVFTFDTNGLGASWNGQFSGSGGLRKTGTGELALTSPNSYSGDTYLAGGKLSAAEGALGTGTKIIFEATSTLAFGDADGTTLGQAVQIGSGTTAILEISAGNTGTLTGQISGPGGLTKTGGGTLVLDRPSDVDPANDYYGQTIVSNGVLQIVGTNALSVNTAVTVGIDGTFELVGVTQNVDSIDGSGSVSIGDGSTLTVGALSGSANIALGAGSELNVGGNGENTTFTGALTGTGTFVKEGSGALVIEGTNSENFEGATNINVGALILNGSLAKSDVTVGDGAVLGGNGTAKSVTLQEGAAVGPGNSPGTLTVGEFTFGGGSLYNAEFGFDALGEPVSDNILVTTIADTSGNAVIQGGARLALDVSKGIQIGHGYEVTAIESAGSIVRTDDAVFDVEYDAPLLEALVAYGADAVTVTFFGISAPWSTKVSTRNQGAVANAVQSMAGDNPLYGAAVILGEVELDSAFNLLSGEIGASAKGVLINDSQFLRGAIFERLWSADNSRASSSMSVAPLGYAAPAAGPALFPVKGQPDPLPPAPASAIWAQGFGSWGSTDGNGNAASLDRDTGGFFIGADTLVDAWRLGVVGGYSTTSFNVDDRVSSGDSDNFHLGVYAGTNWDAVRLRAGAAHSWNDVSTTRVATIPFAQTLEADYDAGTTQVFGELGYGFGAAGFDLEPFVGLAYVSLHTDGYAETGGPAALTTGSDTTGVTYTTLGLRGSTSFALGSALATAKGMLGWRHAFGDVTPLATYTVAAGSDLFTVAGLPIAENSLLVDLGLDVAVSDSLTLGLAYGGQFGNDAQDQSVRGTLDWKF